MDKIMKKSEVERAAFKEPKMGKEISHGRHKENSNC